MGGKLEHGREIESVPVMDEPVALIGQTDDGDAHSVLARESLRLGVENPDEPSAHRAKADKPDPQRLQTVTNGRRMR
jgi:hypothetical protein